jgi:hypothetical protein
MTIPDGKDRKSASNMVLSGTGYRVIINNGGGIYCLQREGKRCKLNSTISEQAITNGADTISIDNIYTQQSSQQDFEKPYLPLPNSPYRSYISLCLSGSQPPQSIERKN